MQLLFRREAFAEILCDTLRGYARLSGHGDTEVHWRSAPMWRRSSAVAPDQWLCNSELNCIFSPRVDPIVLSPIVNEFSNGLRPFRRSLQRYYVHTALDPANARWFAGSRLIMRPEWANPRHQIFVPGNQKIRLLDHARGECVSIWKSGFPRTQFHSEIRGRQVAAEHGVNVPRLIDVDQENAWYREEYVCTAPLNRLTSRGEQEQVAREAWRQLSQLLRGTRERTAISDYSDRLVEDLKWLASGLGWLPDDDRQRLFQNVERLREHVVANEPQRMIVTAMTHGDFQPANIVVAGRDVWVIDWECCHRRQLTYDAWVLASGARATHGLARRLVTALREGTNSGSPFAWLWDDVACMAELPMPRQAGLFLLEEALARITDDANPAFPAGGDRLRSFLPTLDQWPRIVP